MAKSWSEIDPEAKRHVRVLLKHARGSALGESLKAARMVARTLGADPDTTRKFEDKAVAASAEVEEALDAALERLGFVR